MGETLKILVVAGHPADMFDHCGGTLMHHIKDGDSVTCVSLTQGLRIHDEVISDVLRHHVNEYTKEQIDEMIEDRKKVKYHEAVEACGLFGITDIRFLEYDDEILTVNPDMIRKLAKTIRQVQPDVIITHWPYQNSMFGNHHAVTGQLTMAAITAASNTNFEERDPACRLAQVVFMLAPDDVCPTAAQGAPLAAHANYYVDVTDAVEQKVKAIAIMKSQKYDLVDYPRKDIEYWAGNFGVRVAVSYAEAFVLDSPEVGYKIPVCAHRRWLSKADETDIQLYASRMDTVGVEVEERER